MTVATDCARSHLTHKLECRDDDQSARDDADVTTHGVLVMKLIGPERVGLNGEDGDLQFRASGREPVAERGGLVSQRAQD